MSNSAGVETYVHFDGFDSFGRDAFNMSKVRATMRKVGRLVAQRAQMNLALGKEQDGYPVNRTGATLESIGFKVSRAGFLVRVAPRKTSAMKEFYPAYLHYGVKQGSRLGKLALGKGRGKSNRRSKGERAIALAARRALGWRINPRGNYMVDALEDSKSQVQSILAAGFAAALK